jgi:predicted dehydrogenase
MEAEAIGEPVRWGVLGAAAIALGRVLPAMAQAAGCRVVAIASRDGARARAAADGFGIARAYAAYDALLADSEVEAVYIPLPNPLHVDWSVRALEAGKHVLCEKPLALDAAGVERLIQARDRTGRLIEEAYAYRNHPQWDFIRHTLEAGVLGELRAVTGVLAYDNPDPADLRNRPEMGGGGLYDLGGYIVSACRLAFRDEPVRAMAAVELDPRFGTDRLASALLEFPKGQAAFVIATQAGPDTGGSHQHLGLLCQLGWIRVELPFAHAAPTPCRVYLGDASSRGSLPTREVLFEPVDQYRRQAERFSRLVRGEPAPHWPLEDALANLRVIEALLGSARSGRWEAVAR